tara:strand:- start:4138 stop:4566 length:429 start_codon:yes stop_codon:yes gene_type:complete
MDCENDFQKNMSIIKKFYTYLGNFIDVGEFNDTEEVVFLGEYLNEFDKAYDEWYNISEQSNDSDVSTDDETENKNFILESTESSESSENSDEKTSNNSENSSNNEKINQFMNNDTIENILLYKKSEKYLDRCNTYTKSVYQY